ncbi:hypothetical protein BHE74_00056168 [Ensete ventricosum]|nr:hypothetical protein BHE74_00056168 [Ensete ventricosum]
MAYFYFDFRCAYDAPAEVSQQWYQSQGSKEEGRPATTNPHTRPATHGQAAPKPPYKGATDVAHRGSSPQGRCLRARSTAASLKGRQPPAGTPACSATPAKGASCMAPARGCRPRSTLSPAGVTAPVVGVAADGQGQSPFGQGQQRRR